MSSYLEIALFWNAKNKDNGCVCAGVVHAPCSILLNEGDALAVFTLPPAKDPAKQADAPVYVLKVMPKTDRKKPPTGQGGGFAR